MSLHNTPSLAAVILAAVLSLSASVVRADTLANANQFFNYVEGAYSDSLSPAGPVTQEIQGYYVRHYTDTNIYVGLLGNQVYVLGGTYGNTLTHIGLVSDFLSFDADNISDAILTNSRTSCSYFAENLFAQALDIQRSTNLDSTVSITVSGDKCRITTNSIPNHSFNGEGASFVDPVIATTANYEIPLNPSFATSSTSLSLEIDNGVFLNGVKLDLLSAGCYGILDGRIGCNNSSTPWRYDPMSPLNNFATDSHNAHTQPGGQYHYHGSPKAMFDQGGTVASAVIGFAADGFPIFGSYIQEGDSVRKVTSSFQLKDGTRPSTTGSPGGSYDGTFIDDWEYVEGAGDLDECNGMMRNGSYGYYVVDTYPWVLRCYKGTPDSSFSKR